MFREAVQFLIYLLEGIGILVIVAGFLVATLMWLRHLLDRSMHQNYVAYRRQSVRGLILGLEFLVAADIIKTVAVDYTLDSVLMLGMIVLIRSFLVYTLHLEMRNHAD
ncbi:DUF1622 domain-containing protein [Wenzhouxiangella sp. EGI_FJ10409]|uniref:DUF1622 domain-containing protein n=1 Tax=Wenzhouxiangella sp. EGI_FJ10409 TaxID=3243767 RepID=UPI0035E305A4